MDAVQHFEIPYKVRERAKKFYFDAFHWQLFDLPGSGYTLANTVDTEPTGMPKRAGAINGGLTPRTAELTAPTLFIRVTDLKAHLERVRHAGGTVLGEPVARGPVWYARFKDTEGNVLGAIQPRPEGPAPTKAARTGAKKAAPSKPARKAVRRAGSKAAAKSAPKPARKVKAKPAAKKSAKTGKAPKAPAAVWSR